MRQLFGPLPTAILVISIAIPGCNNNTAKDPTPTGGQVASGTAASGGPDRSGDPGGGFDGSGGPENRGGPNGPGGPPGGFGPPAKALTPEQVGLVRAWIDQGAK